MPTLVHRYYCDSTLATPIILQDGNKVFDKCMMKFLMDEGVDASMKGDVPKSRSIGYVYMYMVRPESCLAND